MVTFLIIRGLPGSGKTTLARALTNQVFAADDYFVNAEGEYNYDPTKLAEAHLDCMKRCRQALIAAEKAGRGIVAVTNVFSTKAEVAQYAAILHEVRPMSNELLLQNTRLWVIDLFDQNMSVRRLAEVNTHGVPAGKLAFWRERWEH